MSNYFYLEHILTPKNFDFFIIMFPFYNYCVNTQQNLIEKQVLSCWLWSFISIPNVTPFTPDEMNEHSSILVKPYF